MNDLVKYGLIAAAIGGFYLYSEFGGQSYTEDDIDLDAVLDVTVDSIYAFQGTLDGVDHESLDADDTFLEFAAELQDNYNAAVPVLHTAAIGVAPGSDASLLAYEDLNANSIMDEGEDALFLVEIDGEQSRVIASSRSGAVNDHHFSGTGLLAGYLIGSMMSRQRMAGVTSSSLAQKKPVTARAAAKARAGSGSHSKGK
ncbi:hypothetical protein [Teredinibacter franksiae]|uniref:hypothetical protein n=1 Tax=Teredinibacter franksiae TaxID=2761453 RepID=UPI00162718D9|nr:hypothetical protein [Teredinibacter franksiae]